ncbi:MAG: hypothetical protein NW207_01130 [Cytophagales bacterium]|nr:hypothetical protein [Cytophagales bacterium]
MMKLIFLIALLFSLGYIYHTHAQVQLDATGSGNAFVVTYPAIIVSAPSGGIEFTFKANHSITGAATLNLNSTGAKPIYKNFNKPLETNDIITGQFVKVIYDNSGGGSWQMLSKEANASVSSQWLNNGSNIHFSTGNVGIGTSDPLTGLDVNSKILTRSRLTISRSDGSSPLTTKVWSLDNNNNDLRFIQEPNLTTAGTVKMSLKDDGVLELTSGIKSGVDNLVTPLGNGSYAVGINATPSPGNNNFFAISGNGNASAEYNVMIGFSAGQSNTSGSNNVFLGKAGSDNQSGSENIALGNAALAANRTGNSNIALGNTALYSVFDGSENIGIGIQAGNGIISGSRNIAIGWQAQFGGDVSNSIVIGQGATVSASNQMMIGNTVGSGSELNVGIAVEPTERLDIDGNVRIRTLSNGLVRSNSSGILSNVSETYVTNQTAANLTESFRINGTGAIGNTLSIGKANSTTAGNSARLEIWDAGTMSLSNGKSTLKVYARTNSGGSAITGHANDNGTDNLATGHWGYGSLGSFEPTPVTTESDIGVIGWVGPGINSYGAFFGSGGTGLTSSTKYVGLAGLSHAAIFMGGNVGIGTTTPGEALVVAGNVSASGALMTPFGENSGIKINGNRYFWTNDDNSIHIGYQAGNPAGGGQFNTYVGFKAGNMNTTGFLNAFVGWAAGELNQSGSYNTYMGYLAGNKNITSNQNVMIGYTAGYNNTGGDNTMIGHAAGFSNAGGIRNTFVGSKAGNSNVAADYNTYIGYGAGEFNFGFANVALGYEADNGGGSGDYNVILGYRAGNINNNSGNVFIGYNSGSVNTSGNNNVFVGYNSGVGNTSAVDNVFVGRSAGWQTTIGSNNIFLGNQSGNNNTDGTHNIGIGNFAGPSNTNLSNTVSIGRNANVQQNDQMALGGIGVDAVRVGINNNNPLARLHIFGDLAVMPSPVGIPAGTYNNATPLNAAGGSFFLVTVTGTVALSCITGGVEGKLVTIMQPSNAAGTGFTVLHNQTCPANARITTNAAGTLTSTAPANSGASVTLYYSGAFTGWMVIAWTP